MSETALNTKHCSRKKCHKLLPETYPFKLCEVCRASNQRASQRKRERDRGEVALPQTAPHPPTDQVQNHIKHTENESDN